MRHLFCLSLVMAVGCTAVDHDAKYKSTKMKWVESNKEPDNLFFGHSQNGDVVVAASHYKAMTGLAVTEEELGIDPRTDGTSGDMVCERSTITGSHVPKWYCRYSEEVDRERRRTQLELSLPRLAPGGRNGGGASQTAITGTSAH
jgi:hypothetical protein